MEFGQGKNTVIAVAIASIFNAESISISNHYMWQL